MSSSDIAISVRGLSKSYTISHGGVKATTAGEAIVQTIKHPFRKVERETFWALKDVSFDVKRGDVVGIIGRNGAGKSTLLKILSRITEPTEGVIDLYGRVGSLLEVGTGFHPELTGRENIFLNGAILGMARREIDRQFDAIVEFSGTEKFLDTPVKRYSSGMYVRLAFAVAAHLNPEILVVDEVLAVGDAEFQKKCLGKMKDVAAGGRTVLFVSHNMAAVGALCNNAVMLHAGRTFLMGPVDEVIRKYVASTAAPSGGSLEDRADRQGTGDIIITSVRAVDLDGNELPAVSPNTEFTLEIGYRASSRVERVLPSIDVETSDGVRVTTLYSSLTGENFNIDPGTGILNCRLSRLMLRPDLYTLHVNFNDGYKCFDDVQSAAQLSIETSVYSTGQVTPKTFGSYTPEFTWQHVCAVQPPEREASDGVTSDMVGV